MWQFDLFKLVNDVIVLLLQFVALLSGNYIREYFTRTKKNRKIRLGRITISSLALSVVLLGFSELFINKVSIEVYFTGCFLIGIIGEEMIKLLITGKILVLFGKIFFKNITESVKEVMDEVKKK
jgi:hypothetical protein